MLILTPLLHYILGITSLLLLKNSSFNLKVARTPEVHHLAIGLRVVLRNESSDGLVGLLLLVFLRPLDHVEFFGLDDEAEGLDLALRLALVLLVLEPAVGDLFFDVALIHEERLEPLQLGQTVIPLALLDVHEDSDLGVLGYQLDYLLGFDDHIVFCQVGGDLYAFCGLGTYLLWVGVVLPLLCTFSTTSS